MVRWCGIDVHGLHRGCVHAVHVPVGHDEWLAVTVPQPGNAFWLTVGAGTAVLLCLLALWGPPRGANCLPTRCNGTSLGGAGGPANRAVQSLTAAGIVSSALMCLYLVVISLQAAMRLTVSLLRAQVGHGLAKDRHGAGARLPRWLGSREVPLAPCSPCSDPDFVKYWLHGMLSCEPSQICRE